MKKKQQQVNQVFLPTEIWLHIFSFFDYKQLGKMEGVCKNWESIIKTDSLWHYSGKYHNKHEYLLYCKQLQHNGSLEAKRLTLKKESLKMINFLCTGEQRDAFFKHLKDYACDTYGRNLISDHTKVKNYIVQLWKSKNRRYYESTSSVLDEAILLVFSNNEIDIKELRELKVAITNKKIVFLIKSPESYLSKEITSLFTKVFISSAPNLISSADVLNDILFSAIDHLEKLAISSEDPKKKNCSIM